MVKEDKVVIHARTPDTWENTLKCDGSTDIGDYVNSIIDGVVIVIFIQPHKCENCKHKNLESLEQA